MLSGYSPPFQAFLATLLTWGLTALGASLVFLVPTSLTYRSQRKLLDAALGFAAGVMLAASYWSLLAPALEFAEKSGIYGAHSYIPVSIGLFLGAGFVYAADFFIPENQGDAVAVLSNGMTGKDDQNKKHDTEVELDHNTNIASPPSPQPPLTRQLSARKRNLSHARLSQLDDGVIDEMEAHRNSRKKKSNKSRPSLPAADRMHTRSQSHAGGSASRKNARSSASAFDASSGILDENATDAFLTNPTSADHVEPGFTKHERQQSWHRILLLVIAIVIHNFPEGLAVGVGFGALSTLDGPLDSNSMVDGKLANSTQIAESVAHHTLEYQSRFSEARNLAIGIGLQNFPEGLAVSLPLLRVGYSRSKSFWYGQLSGMVEPVGGLLGAWLISYMQPLLPYALSFAAGAMIFVVCEDLIPETRAPGGFPTLASWFVMIGFVVMMAMDVGLG